MYFIWTWWKLCSITFMLLCMATEDNMTVSQIAKTQENKECTRNGQVGVCRNLNRCQEAINRVYQLIRPQFCGFDGSEALVCCLDKEVAPTMRTRLSGSVATTAKPLTCKPLPDNLAAAKTGRKAWDKCVEYQESLVYPCQTRADARGIISRTNRCRHNKNTSRARRHLLILDGENANYGEFPHMVLLGYKRANADLKSVNWLCAGTIISEKFILTSGVCTYYRDDSPLTYVRLNVLNKRDPVDSADQRWYDIARVVTHPNFNHDSAYDNIAILETSTLMQLDHLAVPACLPVAEPDVQEAVVAGWGQLTYNGKYADILQKVTLKKLPSARCTISYPYNPEIDKQHQKAFDEATHLCIGDNETAKGTCKGDIGGAFVIENPAVHCMYTIIGFPNYGRGCGFLGVPELFIKVSAYTTWIESVVWPD